MPRVKWAYICLGTLLFVACGPDAVVKPAENLAPKANIGGPYNGIEGTPIQFDASKSRDPDGDSLTYAWDLGDGTKGSGAAFTHSYRNNRVYQVGLIVSDSHGASDTVSATVNVANAPPVITALTIPTTTIPLGTAATVQVTFSDPGPDDTLSAQLSWGDQQTSVITVGVASHTYAAIGNYSVTLTVRDNDGGVATRTAAIPIVISAPAPNHPVARIEGPASIKEGQSATFSARSSIAPPGRSLRYRWTFVGFQSSPDDSLVEQGRDYYDSGIYTIRLRVTDNTGAADSASTTLTVINAPPVVTAVLPARQQAVGIPASCRVTFSNVDDKDPHLVTIHWGDGVTDSIGADSLYQNAVTVAHTYAKIGSYTVTATVRDKDGGESGIGSAAYPVIVFDPTERVTLNGYDVFDLGTLGGNAATPRAFNSHDQIVGSSLTASGATHAFLWDNGVMRDLETLGHDASFADKINEAGIVAGTVGRKAGRDNWTDYWLIGTVWRDGVGRVLDSTQASPPVGVGAMNAAGDVIAWNQFGYETTYGWLWHNETWQQLGTVYPNIAWRASQAAAMNERGQIVGISPVHAWGESRIFHAFLWESDSIRDLGVLAPFKCSMFSDCSWAAATAINQNGQIVGVSSDANGQEHFVMWENGAIRDLGVAPVSYPWMSHVVVNDQGQVAASAGGQAFFWNNGSLRSIGSLGTQTEIVGIDNSGKVVGTSVTADGSQHVFVWSESGGMVDLGTGPHGFTAAWAVGINARGDILGLTAPCVHSYGQPQCDRPWQVRAILWRNMQAAASR